VGVRYLGQGGKGEEEFGISLMVQDVVEFRVVVLVEFRGLCIYYIVEFRVVAVGVLFILFISGILNLLHFIDDSFMVLRSFQGCHDCERKGNLDAMCSSLYP